MSERSLSDDGERSDDQEPVENQPVIYPLVSDDGNRRVLEEWLTEHDSYELAAEEPIAEDECDLCIVDYDGFRRHADELRAIKSEVHPVNFPVLLLLSEQRSEIAELDRGEIADSVFVTTVDEIISTPIRQTELEWRIRALSRLREQSLELQAQNDQLRRFREAAEAAGHAIMITDPDETIEYVNPAFEEITGYSRSEVIGETPEILQSGEQSEAYYEALSETVSSGEIWEEEIVNRRKDDETYTAHQTIAPILGDDGDVQAFVAVQTDISEQQELRNRLKRHRDIVQRLDDPIMLQDGDGEFRLVNESTAEFAGVPAEELLGADESLFMDEETAETIERRKSETIEREQPVRYSVEPTFERSDKSAVFSTERYPYYDDDDELSGTIAICRDVTELEERTQQLRVIDNVLRHNLRNSLNVITGYLEQIRSQSSGSTADAAETALANANELLSTSQKSRAITRVLSEETETRAIDIATEVRSVVETTAAEHPEARIDLDAPEHAVVSATTDVTEAIEELVRNAIIHNDRDSPTVELTVRSDAEHVEIRIDDDGPGIPEQDRDVVEAGKTVGQLYHGSGLGLWLVYWIVDRSAGSVEVGDSKTRGTTVTVTFPSSVDDSD